MMRVLKKIPVLALAFVLLLAQPMTTKAEEYTYTVRIFAGAQGTISGQEVVTITGLHYGDRFTFSQKDVTLNNDSKYYIRGIRESGKDNNTITENPSFTVTGDMDYVIGYGLLGDAVAYTVNYVDTDGKTLAPSETYYGNVGDRPVIAYLYIDGYVPQAYNLTGTLLEDASQNQYTFVYTPLSALTEGYTYTPGNTIIHTNVIYEDGGVIVIGGDTGTAAGNAGNNGNGGNTANAGGNTAIDDNVTPTADTPAEIIDIRDDATPLADGITGDDNTQLKITDFSNKISTPVKVVIGMAAALLVLAASWLLFHRKKEDSDEE
jgi:hypothetical protein